MRHMGYGIQLENDKRYTSGIEKLPTRDNYWQIKEGNLSREGVHVICNTRNSYHEHLSTKHRFNQSENHIEQLFLFGIKAAPKRFEVRINLEDSEQVAFKTISEIGIKILRKIKLR